MNSGLYEILGKIREKPGMYIGKPSVNDLFMDVFPMQAVTVGNIATEYAQTLFRNNQYTDYLYFHDLAVQIAESVAE